MDVEVGERAVLERVRLVARLLEVALVEGVGVGDERPALREVADVDLERRRVHRDEDARLVAGREDVVIGEVHLEARDARERAGRRADLGREVGERREVVPEDGRLAREAIARELHPVAGVAGEPDHDPFEVLDRLRRGYGRGIADAAALRRVHLEWLAGDIESTMRSGGEAAGFRDLRASGIRASGFRSLRATQLRR